MSCVMLCSLIMTKITKKAVSQAWLFTMALGKT